MPGKTRNITKAMVSTALVAVAVFPLAAQVQTYTCPTGFGPVPAPPAPAILMQSLKTVANPVIPNGTLGAVRGDLADYIANQVAAIQLGKALFWEMQTGSDNKTACATCHFRAGADGRDRNQLHPGANGTWDGLGPNLNLIAADYPFTTGFSDLDNVTGSQGVRKSTFQGFSKSGAELTASVSDPVFNVGGVNVRQVTGKNAPSTVNAVHNHRNFWNGRAQAEFNGVNPFGDRDATARVWVLGTNGSPTQIDLHVQTAALASQAVGPALNTTEMSAAGRTFADLGHKLLLVKPLALQRVDPADSVLGSLADVSTGLTTTYTAMIQKAFQPKWWKYTKRMPVGNYTMTEANFSLFWGLSIMMYEATLVSDSSPMDQYLLTRVFKVDPLTGLAVLDPNTGLPVLLSDDKTKLTPAIARLAADGIVKSDGTSATLNDILRGLQLFELPVAPPPSFPVPPGFGAGCMGCHVGAELTSASVRSLTAGVEPGDAFLKKAGFDLRMERMFLRADWTPPGPLTPVPLGADVINFDPNYYTVNVVGRFGAPISPSIALPVGTYDTGWYNIGVRPTADDPGLDGLDPFGNNLSWTHFLQTLPDPTIFKVPGNGLGCAGAGNATFPNEILNPLGFPLLSGPLRKTEDSDVAGTFKVPSLRNVEFNGPYFHNGGKATLAQVVDFYDNGGNFANPTRAPAIVPMQLSVQDADSLVAFLLSLTDDRVRLQQAPFDHPQLQVPNGDSPAGTDAMVDIPAVGAAGSPTPIQRFLNLNPFLP